MSVSTGATTCYLLYCTRNRLLLERSVDGCWHLPLAEGDDEGTVTLAGQTFAARRTFTMATADEGPGFAVVSVRLLPEEVGTVPAGGIKHGDHAWWTLEELAAAPLETLAGDVAALREWWAREPRARLKLLDMNYQNLGKRFINPFPSGSEKRDPQVFRERASADIYYSPLIEDIKTAHRKMEGVPGATATLDYGAVTYLLPSHFGFCLGVQRAVDQAYDALRQFPDRRIYILSELIHNPFVNEDLKRRGVRFLQTDAGVILKDEATGKPYWDLVADDDIVLIPAFGATNEDKLRLLSKGLPMNEFDATCMLVEKVWRKAREFAADGFTILIHGKAEHEETKATFSNAARFAPALIVRNLEEVDAVMALLDLPPDEARTRLAQDFAGKFSEGFDPQRDLRKIAVVNQTTLLRDETLRIIRHLEETMSARYGAEAVAEHLNRGSRGTLCYATQVNQGSLETALQTPALDAAIVVGGKNSSNTFQLFRMCAERLGERACYVQSEEDFVAPGQVRHYIPQQDRSHPRAGEQELRSFPVPATAKRTVLITGGASCPDGIIERILQKLNAMYPPDRISAVRVGTVAEA